MENIFTVTLPDIGEGVVEGEVIEWLKNVGDSLGQNEPVVVVMTDKATVELPAPYPGKLSKQYFQPGQIAIKDKPLYDIELDSQDAMASEQQKMALSEQKKHLESVASSKSKLESQPEKQTKDVVESPGPSTLPSDRSLENEALAIPAVRRLAREVNVNLNDIEGSGKEGRVTGEDLYRHLRQQPQPLSSPSAPNILPLNLPGDTQEPIIGIRNLMSKRMSDSKARIPHFSYFEQVEVERLIQLKNNTKSQTDAAGIHLTYMPFFIRALSICMGQHPILNSCCETPPGTLTLHRQQNIGIAVASRHGLIVPVLKNVQLMSLEQLIRSYDDLIHRAQQGKLDAREMREATITISNYGNTASSTGAFSTPIINLPEVAILALSRIHAHPCVKGNDVVVKDVINLSWSFDHRVIDGHTAMQISHDFCTLIRNPAALL